MPKDLKEPDIVKIVNTGIVPRLDDLDLARDYNASQLAEALPQRTPRCRSPTSRTSISRRWRNFPSTTWGCRAWTSRSSRCALIVYGALARAPARLRRRARRHEQGGSEEVHVLPVRRGREIATSRRRWTSICAGKPGVRYHAAEREGRDRGRGSREEPPQPGANVYLTIDARIQMHRGRGVAGRRPRGGGGGRSEQRRHPRHGLGAVIRSEYLYSQHQGERLGSAPQG